MLKLMMTVVALQAPQVAEVWATSGADSLPFGHVNGAIEMANGTVWVADAFEPFHIHVLSAEGEVVRQFAREGEGPGELRCANAIVRTPSGGAAVLCGSELHLFKQDGSFDRRLIFERQVWNPKDLLVTESEVFVSGALSHTERANEADPHAVAVFDRATGELLRTFHPSVPSNVPRNSLYVSGGPMVLLDDGALVVANAAPFKLVRYAGDDVQELARDTLVADIADDFTYPARGGPPGLGLQSHRWSYPRAFYVGLEADGALLVVTRWLAEEGGVDRSVWDRYTLDGARTRRIDVPIGYEVYERTRNGDYLAVRENHLEEAVLVRLRVR